MQLQTQQQCERVENVTDVDSQSPHTPSVKSLLLLILETENTVLCKLIINKKVVLPSIVAHNWFFFYTCSFCVTSLQK